MKTNVTSLTNHTVNSPPLFWSTSSLVGRGERVHLAFILLGPYLEPVSFSPFHNRLCQDSESSNGPAPVSTCQEVALKWLHPLPLPHWHVAPMASKSSQSYLFQASNWNMCLACKPVNFHFVNMTFSKIPLLNSTVYFNLIELHWLN